MDDKQDFTNGSIPKKLVQFMLPVLGALVLQAMYGAVDMLIVGRFGTTTGMSGVSTGSNIVNLITFTISGLAMGVTILLGQYVGEKKNEQIGKLLGGTICFFLVLALALTVLIVVFARPLAVLMQAPEEALDLTVLYLRICGAGIVFVIAYNVISCVFRGLGNSRLPLIFVGIACVVNILLDLILVAGMQMNVAGAAIATIAAQAVSVILSLVIISRQNLPFGIKRSDIKFSSEVRHFLFLGAPLALQELLTNLTFLALCAFINRLGLDASSGYGVGQKIGNFIMLIPGSLNQSMASFVAQNVGAGREDRARGAMYCGIAIGSAMGVVTIVTVYLFSEQLAGIFTNDSAVIVRASEYLRGMVFDALVTSILFTMTGYFNGHGRSVFVMVQGLVQSFALRLPLAYYMSIQPGISLTWIGLAAPIATCFGIVICLVYYRRMRKQLADDRAGAYLS